jgi:hypothetical protein
MTDLYVHLASLTHSPHLTPPSTGMAQLVSVDTPTIDAVLLWGQAVLGKEYVKRNGVGMWVCGYVAMWVWEGWCM